MENLSRSQSHVRSTVSFEMIGGEIGMEYENGEGDKGTKDAGEEKGEGRGRTKETEECNGHSRRERRTIGPAALLALYVIQPRHGCGKGWGNTEELDAEV
jgi:hypothetical protein